MHNPLSRWARVATWAILPVTLPMVAGVALLRAQAATTAPSATVAPDAGMAGESVDSLKLEAFKDLRGGQFDRGTQLLGKAAAMSSDPTLVQMAGWTQQFEAQREIFAVQRHTAFEKAATDVELLLKNNHPDYALDAATRAYLLADDKATFTAEPWAYSLINDSIHRADTDEQNGQWLKAMRIYSDLGSLLPTIPTWKDRLHLTTRRVRLLAMYVPDELKKIQDSEARERNEVDALIKPTTQPTTQPMASANGKPTPATDPADDDSFKVDWHETLRGVQMDMLRTSLDEAVLNYYRAVDYPKMMTGGLNGLRAVCTTAGLEETFTNLGDPVRKKAFMDALDQAQHDEQASNADNARQVMSDWLTKLETINMQTVQLPEQVLVSEFADGAFAQLDPFSTMIWPSDLEEFTKTTQGEFSGIGIQIQSDEDGGLKVVSPLEDTPAYKAGIKAGDVIVKINGKEAKGITLTQAVKTITGPSGTTVTVTVRSPDNTLRDFTIRRETIRVASVKGWTHKPGGGGWDYFVDPVSKIAYLRITNFTRTTGDDLDRTVDDLKSEGAKAVILDLRYNPGGLLTAAIDVSDKFLHEGVIVSTRPDRETMNQPTVATAKADDNECDLPLVVLVNQYSASASEIVSGALKDDHRAIIVGERTFGKGSVQIAAAAARPHRLPQAHHRPLLPAQWPMPAPRGKQHRLGCRSRCNGTDDPRADASGDRRPTGSGCAA